MRSAGDRAVMYLAAAAFLLMFAIGVGATLRFAFRLLWHMLDINVRAHQELQLLAARRRR